MYQESGYFLLSKEGESFALNSKLDCLKYKIFCDPSRMSKISKKLPTLEVSKIDVGNVMKLVINAIF